MSDLVRLVHEPIDLDALQEATAADGAVCLFVGVVRNENRGRPVERLEYEAYEDMALPLMAEIAAETRRRYPVSRCGSSTVSAAWRSATRAWRWR